MSSIVIPTKDEDGNIVTTQNPLTARDNHTFDGQGFMKICPDGVVTKIEYTIASIADMSGVEIIGAVAGDKVQMQVVDDENGTYSFADSLKKTGTGVAVPNAVLNQYGTNWYVRPDVFLKVIPYGARVYPNMVVTFLYENNSGAGRNIYVNLDLHKLIIV